MTIRSCVFVVSLLGLCMAANAQTTVFTASFEAGEVNPGKIGGVINTVPYPYFLPEDVSDNEYGWQVKDHNYGTGYAEISDFWAHQGVNATTVVNKFLRSDFEHTLQPGKIYTFTIWLFVPAGMPLTLDNRIVVKDQTNNYFFVNEPSPKTVTLPAYNTWCRRSVSFDTTGYTPATTNANGTIDVRLGAVFSGASGAGALTDDWSLTYAEKASVVTYWLPGSTADRTEWADAGNWNNGVPDADDHVITHVSTPMPVIDSAVPSIRVLTPSWHIDAVSSVMIASGGSLNVVGLTRLGNESGSISTLDITGGILTSAATELGYHAAGRGNVNLDAGSFDAGTLIMGPGTVKIDLERGATMTVAGDQVGNGNVAAWKSQGKLTVAEGAGTVTASYNSGTGKTTIQPAQTPMNKNGGFQVPTIVPPAGELRQVPGIFPLDLNRTTASWSYGDQSGVASTGHVYLGGVVPNGGQAAIIFDNAVVGNAGQVWQDLVGVLQDGVTYNISWSEAMGWATGGTTRKPDFGVYLHEILTAGGWGVGHQIGLTSEISNTSLLTRTASFTVDLKGGTVSGYRLVLDARGLEGNPSADYGFVVVDNMYITPASWHAPFVDVSAATGLDAYNPENVDVAASWGDFNGDGWVDVYLGSYSYVEGALFQNNSGTSFTKLNSLSPIANLPGLFIDYDNDGRMDVSTSMAGGHIMKNNGFGSFSWMPGIFDAHTPQSECAAWADFNNDGYIDSYRTGWEVASSGPYYADALFLSQSGNHFAKTWEESGDIKPGRGVTAADFDEDGDIDIYVSNYRIKENYLWLNDGTGSFTNVADSYGVAADAIPCTATYPGGHTIGSAWGDLDNDGHLDLVVGNLAHPDACQDRPRFYRNQGPSGGWHFADMSANVNCPYVQSHASPALADFDNDGDLDIFLTAVAGTGYPGELSTCLRNDGNWTFTDVTNALGLAFVAAQTNFAASWGDYDNDGDLDLFTARKLFRNQISNGNHWLMVRLVGNGASGNLQSLGAQVRIVLGGGVTLTRQVEAGMGWTNQNDPRLHFGLGANASPVTLQIRWPNGTLQIVSNVAIDQVATIVAEAADGNLSFERPNGFAMPAAYGVVPTPSLAVQGGSGWDFVPGTTTGIANKDSGFLANVYSPAEGTQFAYLQTGNKEIAQTLSGFEPGKEYEVTWWEARRPNNPAPEISQLSVLMDTETLMAAHDVTSDAGFVQQSAVFTATASSHRLRFYHTVPANPSLDVTVFVDNVQVAPASSCNTPQADLNADNFVDGADYGLFAGCFNGTGNPINPGCECADLNGDLSVDGADYGLFAGCFNGTGNPSPCG